jgi:glycosyltransferase involved in cell wall biosynthesis
LEAAALGKPIVCFAEAGGMPEFVEEDCGFVVPYLDVAAMAERVVCLLESRECRLKMGEAARHKITERHDVSVAGPQIVNIIERTAGWT